MFGNTLAETQKAVLALLVSGLTLLGFFVVFDPGFNEAAVAVTVGAFNVLGVFLAKNHTPDDVQKSVSALAASTLGLVGFFVTVDANTTETVLGIVAALVNVYAVYRVRNEPVTEGGF